MTEMVTVHYDFVRHQHHISAIGSILGWLGERGFSIVSFTRPPSNNPYCPNVEFVAQRACAFTAAEAQAWKQINHYPGQLLRGEKPLDATSCALEAAKPEQPVEIAQHDTLHNAWQCLKRCEGKSIEEDKPYVDRAFEILNKLVCEHKREISSLSPETIAKAQDVVFCSLLKFCDSGAPVFNTAKEIVNEVLKVFGLQERLESARQHTATPRPPIPMSLINKAALEQAYAELPFTADHEETAQVLEKYLAIIYAHRTPDRGLIEKLESLTGSVDYRLGVKDCIAIVRHPATAPSWPSLTRPSDYSGDIYENPIIIGDGTA